MGFAAPQGVEGRFAVFIRFGLFHGFAALGRRHRRAGQQGFVPVPHAVQVHIRVQRQGKARRGHSAHSAHVGGHIHLHIHVQRARTRRIGQLGLAGIGENHALRQGELQQIIAGLQDVKAVIAFFVGLQGALQPRFNEMQGDFRAGQARFLAVPFAVIVRVEPHLARQGAGAHHADAQAQGFLGRQGKRLGQAHVVFIRRQTVIVGVHFLAHGAGGVMLGINGAHPVGGGRKIPHHSLAATIRIIGGDHVGFALVFVHHLHRHAPHRRLGFHAAAVDVGVLKGDHAHQTGGFRRARVDLAAFAFAQGEPGGVARVALGGQHGAVLAVEGKVVFLAHFHPQAVFTRRQPVEQKFAGFGSRGVFRHLAFPFSVLRFQGHPRAGQAAFVARDDPVGGFVHPNHTADLARFGQRPLNAKDQEQHCENQDQPYMLLRRAHTESLHRNTARVRAVPQNFIQHHNP